MKLINSFSSRGIDILKIDTMNSLKMEIVRNFTYSGIIDIKGKSNQANIKYALAELEEFTTKYQILGCYQNGNFSPNTISVQNTPIDFPSTLSSQKEVSFFLKKKKNSEIK